MQSRRKFIKISTLAGIGTLFSQTAGAQNINSKTGAVKKPVVLSTWRFGIEANEEAWKTLSSGGNALDAVEKGVRIVEDSPDERSVGYGGRPDREGSVTLDACIMDHKANIGSVAALQHIKNPISVARAVMEKTPHVMLVGNGALEFALEQGFKKMNLLTPESEREWKEWLKKSDYKPPVNIENHDTIGMIALDAHGNLSGACTTSGLAYKMHGRVGDSPIIGAGLFVDNEIGAATATGHGEEVIRTCGTHLVVELMRQGFSPQKACEEAVNRIHRNFRLQNRSVKDTQIGFLALNKSGDTGAFCLQKGFNYAYRDNSTNKLIDARSLL